MKQVVKKRALGAVLSLSILLGGCSSSLSTLPDTTDDYSSSNVPLDIADDCPEDYGKSGVYYDGETYQLPHDTEITTDDVEWKGHEFTNDDYLIAFYDDEFMVLIKHIEVVDNTISFTYSFYNESENTVNPCYSFWSEPSQMGKSYEQYEPSVVHPILRSGYKVGNEEKSVAPGTHIDDCYGFASFDPNLNEKVHISVYLLHSTHCIIDYNVNTGEFSIK